MSVSLCYTASVSFLFKVASPVAITPISTITVTDNITVGAIVTTVVIYLTLNDY